MSKTAIVWRQSAYETGRCSHCGKRVVGPDGIQPSIRRTRQLFRRGRDGVMRDCIVCDCGNVVAVIKTYEGKGDPGERCGRWKGTL